ncbi:alpha/beta hydrolase [Pseudomonas sp. Tri1]|uniref:alpha/beta hydrolase n=1 Tax=Pseudomonas sp. Tri1 TaxID=2823875 RepID=UPI001B31CCBB|nr:alpha/beta hydrolase [Pseudomonas sp. Tri1]
MRSDERLDPAFQSLVSPGTEAWTLSTLPAIRTRVHSTFRSMHRSGAEELWTTGTDAERLRLCLYRPKASTRSGAFAAILYLHGGGFVLGKPEMADDTLCELAETLQAIIVAVDYRLAPEHPFPVPLEDCYAALGWIFENQHNFRFDLRRIVVMGHSAGGGLAAALSILARDRGEYSLAGQVLIYPMLDHRTGSTDSPYPPTGAAGLSWLPAPNKFCWDCLRGDYNLDDHRIGLFSPALQPDLGNLPATFISVGSLDLFLMEDVEFAMRLSRAGVAMELHVYPGAPHMFDQVAGRITTQSTLDITRALQAIVQ